ncbi:hypothetical protein G6F65_016249 [Rhizopus arrhizus]|nr:hypothetical protein G6F65_016249 [Rhizopus arrhizus]
MRRRERIDRVGVLTVVRPQDDLDPMPDGAEIAAGEPGWFVGLSVGKNRGHPVRIIADAVNIGVGQGQRREHQVAHAVLHRQVQMFDALMVGTNRRDLPADMGRVRLAVFLPCPRGHAERVIHAHRLAARGYSIRIRGAMTNHRRRVAGDDGIRRPLAAQDRAGRDHASAPQYAAVQQHAIGADPAIFFDQDPALARHEALLDDGEVATAVLVVRGRQGRVGGYQGAATNSHAMARIDHHAGIQIDLVADVHVAIATRKFDLHETIDRRMVAHCDVIAAHRSFDVSQGGNLGQDR